MGTLKDRETEEKRDKRTQVQNDFFFFADSSLAFSLKNLKIRRAYANRALIENFWTPH